MESFDQQPPDEQLEQLLRRAAPGPTAAFESTLERHLFPDRGRVSARRGRIAGLVAATGGLAAVAVIAALAGGGPLAGNGGSSAKARPGCTTVYVTKVEPVGRVVKKADGTVTVETNRRPVVHEQQRCR
ncbi:MAG: hypothetical protein AAGC46_20525 [Solirubrobacteraceae bacterium]|nr:hypothetical protein [Patulibacter sp.]